MRLPLSLSTWQHPFTHVLLMTTPLPTGAAYANTRPYQERGWCFVEQRLSGMVKDHNCLWDMSAYKGATGYADMRKEMKAKRLPFMSPERVARELSEGVETGAIAFTAKGDVDVVGKMYQRGFVSAIDDFTYNRNTERVQDGYLFYTNLGWTNAEGEVIVEALAYARKHCSPSYGKRIFKLGYGNSFDMNLMGLTRNLKTTSKKNCSKGL